MTPNNPQYILTKYISDQAYDNYVITYICSDLIFEEINNLSVMSVWLSVCLSVCIMMMINIENAKVNSIWKFDPIYSPGVEVFFRYISEANWPNGHRVRSNDNDGQNKIG